MMPLSDVSYVFNNLSLGTFKGLPGLLADVLPDNYGNAVIDSWLATSGRSIESFNIIERLCYIGTRGMGALEIYSNNNPFIKDSTDAIALGKLVELSKKILNHKEELSANDTQSIKEIIKVGTSAGGARAKAIIAYNEQTGDIRSGQIDCGVGYSYWILKLDGIDEDKSKPYTRIEYAYYLMAKNAKIIMSESRLFKKNGYYHFMTKRFDRVMNEDGKVTKIHMQTLGSLMHVDYKEAGLISYEQVSQMMYRLELTQRENEQFYRRMVFNVLSRNQDDHVKNISFLMDKAGKWSLSPAYDMTYAFNPVGDWTATHQMRINNKRSDITLDDLLSSAIAMRIKEKRALVIIDEVKNSINKWLDYCTIAEIKKTVAISLEKTFIKL
jgi:serine/threonine-protein kinase HipA